MKKSLLLFLFVIISSSVFSEKYNFIFFYKENNQKTEQLKELFEETMSQVSDKADFSVMNKADEKAAQLVKKYALQHAPMPFVLVLAPNGAIMRGLPLSFTQDELLSSISTPVVENCLLALQNHKLVLLCSQNENTTSNEKAMAGVKQFAADPKYRGVTEIITLDPSKTENKQFLQNFSIEINEKEASTLFLAPPAEMIGYFKGATTKEQLTTSLKQASSGCCPGGRCAGGKCCP